jgi:hypothetical protein
MRHGFLAVRESPAAFLSRRQSGRHVGDPILESNLTRRVDFALFMVEALENAELRSNSLGSGGARGRHTR